LNNQKNEGESSVTDSLFMQEMSSALVVISADPLGIDTERRIYHEQTEEPSK